MHYATSGLPPVIFHLPPANNAEVARAAKRARTRESATPLPQPGEAPLATLVRVLGAVAATDALAHLALDANAAAQALLGCLDQSDRDLDLTRLDTGTAMMLALSPPEVWAALQRHALSLGPDGIGSATLGPVLTPEVHDWEHGPRDATSLGGPEAQDRLVLQGLKELTTLERVTLHTAASTAETRVRSTILDLGSLPGLRHVTIEGSASAPWKICVRQGTTVDAKVPPESAPHLQASVVFTLDRQGRINEDYPLALEGVVAARAAPLNETPHDTLVRLLVPEWLKTAPRHADVRPPPVSTVLPGSPFPIEGPIEERDPLTVAARLLACVKGRVLDLSALPDTTAHMLAALPEEAWLALARHGLNQSPLGIRSVVLGQILTPVVEDPEGDIYDTTALRNWRASDESKVLKCLKLLTNVRELTLEPPGREDPRSVIINVAVLPRLQHVTLKGRHFEALKICVPPGTTVEADAAGPVFTKSRVYHGTAQGVLDEAHAPYTLRGVIHDRALTEAEWDEPAAQDMGRSDFHTEIRDNTPLIGIPQDQVTAFWLRQRIAYRWAKALAVQERPTPRFDYTVFEDPAAFAAQPNLAEDHRRMLRGRGAMFDTAQFGAILADAFAALRPGRFRHFIFQVGHDTFGLELRVTQPQPAGAGRHGSAFIAVLFDPGNPTIHRRLVLDSPQPGTLESWMGEDDVARMSDYDTPRLGVLYPCQPNDEDRHRNPLSDFAHVPPASRGSARFVRLAMSTIGTASAVAEGVRCLIERQLAPDQVEQQLSAMDESNPSPALHAAAGLDGTIARPAAMVEYLRSVFGAELELDAEAKYRLASGTTADGQHECVMSKLLDNIGQGGDWKILQNYLRVTVPTARHALGPQLMMRLLTDPVDTDSGPRPVLSRLCDVAAVPLMPRTHLGQFSAIYTYVCQIVRSPALTPQEKAKIAAAEWGHLGYEASAIQLALSNDRPLAAAAIMLAIADATERQEQLQDDLMGALGIGPQEVRAAVRPFLDPHTHPEEAQWAATMDRKLEKLGTAMSARAAAHWDSL